MTVHNWQTKPCKGNCKYDDEPHDSHLTVRMKLALFFKVYRWL